jgi:RNA polymerase sigma-70 factor, ECF subfamily
MRRFRDGDDGAADRLFRRYAARLRALADGYCRNGYERRFDADDIVQSVFRVFFDGIRRNGYDAPPEGEIWGLLAVLALNKVRKQMEHHRAAKRDVQRTTSVEDLTEGVRADTDEGAAALLKLVLDEQLASLSEANRQIILLRMDGHEVKEIADRVGRSRRTVERVLQEFRDRLTPTE